MHSIRTNLTVHSSHRTSVSPSSATTSATSNTTGQSIFSQPNTPLVSPGGGDRFASNSLSVPTRPGMSRQISTPTPIQVPPKPTSTKQLKRPASAGAEVPTNIRSKAVAEALQHYEDTRFAPREVHLAAIQKLIAVATAENEKRTLSAKQHQAFQATMTKLTEEAKALRALLASES